MDIPILYEDEDIVVVDKPSGITVNRAETVTTETVQDWSYTRYGISPVDNSVSSYDGSRVDYDLYFRQRAGIVHRLDKETSGVMVLAKNVNSFIELLRQFKEREVKKEYIALTHGLWKDAFGEISVMVGRMRHNRTQFGVREDGRESITTYRVEETYTSWQFPRELKVEDRGYTGFSLVRFAPKTGRTHQIRVHSRHKGHPIVGDDIYAGRRRSREDRKWTQRLLLHACRLELAHPTRHTSILFESPAHAIHDKVVTYLKH